MKTSVHLRDLEPAKLAGRSWLGWQTLVWTGAVALGLYALGIGNHALWGYHEPYVAGIIREMAASVWVSFVAWRLSSARAASWAGFTLATSALFFEIGQTAVVDMALTAAVTFALGLACLVAGGFPWVLVKEAGLHRVTAAGLTALALGLGAWSARRLQLRDHAGAFKVAMLQWTLFLVVFLEAGVPAMDRRDWRPLTDPYRRALALREAGASLAGAGLTETQMGFASLTLRQRLPTVAGPAQLKALLERTEPVAVLVEPRLWSAARALGVGGEEVPTDIAALAPARRSRAPVLVVNRVPPAS